MSNRILSELRDLQKERGDSSPFKSDLEFQKWADQVIPRLQFDKRLAIEFKNAVSLATSLRQMHSSNVAAINEAIGILNQAVLVLEEQVRTTEALPGAVIEPLARPAQPVPLPDKVTLKWLYEHAPVSFYFWLIGLLASALGGGLWLSESAL